MNCNYGSCNTHTHSVVVVVVVDSTRIDDGLVKVQKSDQKQEKADANTQKVQ